MIQEFPKFTHLPPKAESARPGAERCTVRREAVRMPFNIRIFEVFQKLLQHSICRSALFASTLGMHRSLYSGLLQALGQRRNLKQAVRRTTETTLFFFSERQQNKAHRVLGNRVWCTLNGLKRTREQRKNLI